MKKLSELMLEGYARVGKQARYVFCCGGDAAEPESVCALGAANLATTGCADVSTYELCLEWELFERRVGLRISDLNDEGMSIPDIAGIAAAEGL